MKMIDARCQACGWERNDFLLRLDGVIKACDECYGPMERILRETGHRTAHIHGDDIPGGMLIKNGICNEDGTAKRYYTFSAMREAAKAKGLINRVEHEPDPQSGSDKSKHTQRFIGLPSSLNPEQEAERLRAWHEHEAALKCELDEDEELVNKYLDAAEAPSATKQAIMEALRDESSNLAPRRTRAQREHRHHGRRAI